MIEKPKPMPRDELGEKPRNNPRFVERQMSGQGFIMPAARPPKAPDPEPEPPAADETTRG